MQEQEFVTPATAYELLYGQFCYELPNFCRRGNRGRRFWQFTLTLVDSLFS